MKIATKIRLNTLFTVSMIILIALTTLISFQEINSVLQKNSIVDQIVINAFDLNLVTYEYLSERLERSREQWYLRHESLSKMIESVQFQTRDEQFLFSKIKHNHDNMKKIFSMLVNHFKEAEGQKNKETEKEFAERFSAQLLLKSQNVVTGAEQLNKITHNKISAVQKKHGWIIIFVILTGSIIIINSLILSQSISKPIAKLREGAEIIGKGDLDHSIIIHTKDEIGELSGVFNTMAKNLAAITVSRYKMVQEIIERKAAEESLRIAKDELTLANEQLQQEIAEHEYAEEKLRKVKNYLNNIINSMPSVLVGTDTMSCVTIWNLEAEKVTGISSEKAEGKPLESVFPQLAEHIGKIHETLKERKPRTLARVMNRTGEDVRYTDVMFYPLVTNGVEGTVLRVDDVTTRVRLEEMMIQTEKMMSVGGLAAGMAHEINNPLAGILQSSQNILRRVSPDLPANQKAAEELGTDLNIIIEYLEKRGILKFLQGIRESGERAASIVENMLQFSRRSESRIAPISLSELLNKTIELASHDYDLKKKYDFRNIEIIREFEHDMPEVPCVPTEIEQVILNLLRNAAQAMQEGVRSKESGVHSENLEGLSAPENLQGFKNLEGLSPVPRIILRLKKEQNMARIEVEDNGSGMDEKICKRIFEPFFTTKEIGIGTGLGLSVSYFIITNNHKGSIQVASECSKGTCFTILLPLERSV